MTTTPRYVLPSGPFDAKVLFVGEGPGKDETARPLLGPFTGMTGRAIRGVLKYAGLQVEKTSSRDIRFTNVIPFNPGKIDGSTYDRLLAEHWDVVSDDLARMTPRVIVACGGLALRRLTGMTDIRGEHGSVYFSHEIPEHVTFGGALYRTRIPDGSLVIPMLHPAGVMHTKIRAEWLQCKRVLDRVALYAMGAELVRDEFEIKYLRDHDAGTLDSVLAGAATVVIDTEFDPVTKVPFLIGLLTDKYPSLVYSFKPTHALNALLRKHLGPGSNILKVAHSYVADAEAMATVGVNIWGGRWWDTLQAFSPLYPDTSVGLSWAMRHYFDNVFNWKDKMAHDDPEYNGIDVRSTWRLFEQELQDAQQANVIAVLHQEVFPCMPLSWALEARGMKVDREASEQTIAANIVTMKELQTKIEVEVKEVYVARGLRMKRSMKDMERLLAGMCFRACDKHPTYGGVRKKRFIEDGECTCRQVYEDVGNAVDRAPLRPFKASNHHDMKWLLYDRAGWGLPKQFNRGNLTSDADAVAHITAELAKARESPKSKWFRGNADEIVEVLALCNDVSHLDKMNSTFLAPPLDEQDFTHPPYRQWGAGTGRPAGGFDEAVGDKGSSQYAFNALNIPEECRHVFVPREHGVEILDALALQAKIDESVKDVPF